MNARYLFPVLLILLFAISSHAGSGSDSLASFVYPDNFDFNKDNYLTLEKEVTITKVNPDHQEGSAGVYTYQKDPDSDPSCSSEDLRLNLITLGFENLGFFSSGDPLVFIPGNVLGSLNDDDIPSNIAEIEWIFNEGEDDAYFCFQQRINYQLHTADGNYASFAGTYLIRYYINSGESSSFDLPLPNMVLPSLFILVLFRRFNR